MSRKSWSATRRWLEEEMLCPALRCRVRYHCTKYPGMDGAGLFGIFVDGKVVHRFSMKTVAAERYPNLDEADKGEWLDRWYRGFWRGYWNEMENTPTAERREFDDGEFAAALEKYRAIPIAEALTDEHPIVRMFAILDRRVGKRTLQTIRDALDAQPDWVKPFVLLRLEAENML